MSQKALYFEDIWTHSPVHPCMVLLVCPTHFTPCLGQISTSFQHQCCSFSLLLFTLSSSHLSPLGHHFHAQKAGVVWCNVPGGMSAHNSEYKSDYNLFVFLTHAYKNLFSYLPVAHLNQIFEPSFCMQTLPACSALPLLLVEVKSVITKPFLLYYMYFLNI